MKHVAWSLAAYTDQNSDVENRISLTEINGIVCFVKWKSN